MNDQQQQPPPSDRAGAGSPQRADQSRADQPRADQQDAVDDASNDSFPASDPPSFTDTTATRNPDDH